MITPCLSCLVVVKAAVQQWVEEITQKGSTLIIITKHYKFRSGHLSTMTEQELNYFYLLAWLLFLNMVSGGRE